MRGNLVFGQGERRIGGIQQRSGGGEWPAACKMLELISPDLSRVLLTVRIALQQIF